MNPPRICVIGTGRMGWAILRQFTHAESRGQIELFAYDPGRTMDEDLGGQIKWVPSKWTPEELMTRVDPRLIIHAAPFSTQPIYIELALRYHKDIVTLGQMTEFVLGLLQDKETFGHGSRIIPDCGLAPGFLNALAADIAWENEVNELHIECGGLPLDPSKGGPLHYGLSFSPQGLVQEYLAPAYFKDQGSIRKVSPLSLNEEKMLESARAFHFVDPIVCSRLERSLAPPFIVRTERGVAFQSLESTCTADGTSVMPWDKKFEKFNHISYRTLRYSGHYECFQKALQMNLLDRPDFLRLLSNLPSAVPDVVLFRVVGFNQKIGETYPIGWEGAAYADALLDAFPGLEDCGVSVFSAMQHMTGWPTVFAALCLLGLWDEGRREDGILFNGYSLEYTLERGGVILPYELMKGRILLEKMKKIIPYIEVHTLGN